MSDKDETSSEALTPSEWRRLLQYREPTTTQRASVKAYLEANQHRLCAWEGCQSPRAIGAELCLGCMFVDRRRLEHPLRVIHDGGQDE